VPVLQKAMTLEIAVGNQFALIDDADMSIVAPIKWRTQICRYKDREWTYAVSKVGKKLLYMHRLILNAQKEEVVDHINHDTLDNRRSNIRICTQRQNMQNSVRPSNNTSGFKGVFFDKKYGWRVQIRVDGRKKEIGHFQTAELAAQAYDEAARKYHGEFARLNIPYTNANKNRKEAR
jgi:hypothetical protein